MRHNPEYDQLILVHPLFLLPSTSLSNFFLSRCRSSDRRDLKLQSSGTDSTVKLWMASPLKNDLSSERCDQNQLLSLSTEICLLFSSWLTILFFIYQWRWLPQSGSRPSSPLLHRLREQRLRYCMEFNGAVDFRISVVWWEGKIDSSEQHCCHFYRPMIFTMCYAAGNAGDGGVSETLSADKIRASGKDFSSWCSSWIEIF